MKKILMMILAAALGFSAWANPVAKVGTTEYETIDEAIAAWTSGTTLTLLADVQLTTSITVTEAVTLNLSTFTLTAPKSSDAIIVAGSGSANLTVTADSANPGCIKSSSNCIYANYNDAKVKKTITINNGIIDGSCVFNKYQSENSGEKGTPLSVTINGGIFKKSITAYRCYYLTINGGTFESFTGGTAYQTSTCKSFYYGGRYKGFLTTTSGNSRAYYYGSVDIKTATKTDFYYIDDEGYYVLTKGQTYLPTTYKAMGDNYRCTDADIAIGKCSTIVLCENIAATTNKTISSGTLNVDASANGSSYSGNVTLTGTSGKFIVKFREDVGYYGNVTASRSGYRISLSETEADGIVTRTYTVQSNTAITAANAEAGVVSANGSTNYYGSVYDAFYAVDGNTEGKTIVLMKDASNARILTNGKAVNEAGKTVATFDLNGHKFTLQGADTGNDADYTLTVIDSSEEGTGEVMNTTFSLLKIALTGTGDYSGKYTMKVQGGTWHFNPSAVVYDGNTYDLVDEGYIAVDNGNGTWTVGKFLIETGDLHTDTEIGDDTTEAVYTISTTVKVGNRVVSTTDSQTINVSVPAEKDIGGTTLRSVKLDSLVEAAVESAGVDASSVTKVEIFVSAVAVNAADGTITYEVKPEMIVTVTKGGVSTESEIELTNADLASGATFTFPLDVTALDVQVGGWVKVKHVSEDAAYDDETMYLQAVAGENEKVVVMVTASHFSTFTLSPLTSQPVTTSVQSANLLGAIKIESNTASNLYVAVPFEGFESDGAARKAKDVVHPANLTAETKMYVYDKNSDSHDVYKVASGAWAPAPKVTIDSSNAATFDQADVNREVPAGTGVLVARANAGDNVYVYGQIPGTTVNPEPFANGQTFVAPPYTNATVEVSGVKYIDLNASTWTGVQAAQQNRKLISGADFIQFRDANNRLIKYYYDGTGWGLQPTYAKLAAYQPYVEGGKALVPQGTAFWYCSSVGGAKVEWK